MSGQLRYLHTIFSERALYLVAVGTTLGCTFEIEQSAVPRGNLHALVAEIRGPARNRIERIKRRCISGKLRKKNRRTFNCFHCPWLRIPKQLWSRSQGLEGRTEEDLSRL